MSGTHLFIYGESAYLYTLAYIRNMLCIVFLYCMLLVVSASPEVVPNMHQAKVLEDVLSAYEGVYWWRKVYVQ